MTPANDPMPEVDPNRPPAEQHPHRPTPTPRQYPDRPAPDGHAPDHVHDDAGVHGHAHGARPGEAEWDARYGENTSGIWSGAPNHALVVEAGALRPGRVLDVGCGEGADAVWLAGRGWQVVGLDPSGVALGRARSAAEAAGVEWVHGQLHEVADDLPAASFDLVSAFYPTLFHDTDPLPSLTRLVAPGGSLLVVHHADVDPERARAHGFDPAELLSPAEVASGVGEGWSVAVDERRTRVIDGGAGAHHADDLVVRVVRDAPPPEEAAGR